MCMCHLVMSWQCMLIWHPMIEHDLLDSVCMLCSCKKGMVDVKSISRKCQEVAISLLNEQHVSAAAQYCNKLKRSRASRALSTTLTVAASSPFCSYSEFRWCFLQVIQTWLSWVYITTYCELVSSCGLSSETQDVGMTVAALKCPWHRPHCSRSSYVVYTSSSGRGDNKSSASIKILPSSCAFLLIPYVLGNEMFEGLVNQLCSS